MMFKLRCAKNMLDNKMLDMTKKIGDGLNGLMPVNHRWIK